MRRAFFSGSVGNTLNLVFLGLALALAASLLLQMGQAWRGVTQSKHVESLAATDLLLFQATQVARNSRGETQTALLSLDDPRAEITGIRDRVDKAITASLTSARKLNMESDAIAKIASSWQGMGARWQEMLDLAARPKAERDLKKTETFFKEGGFVVDHLNNLAVVISGEGRIADPVVGELSTIRQLAWSVRTSSGGECSLSRATIASGNQMTPEGRASVERLRGSGKAVWELLDDILARPGLSADLRTAAKTGREAYDRSNAERDATYAKLDNSGKPAVAAAEWTRLCNAPFAAIVALAQVAIDNTQRYAAQNADDNQRWLVISAGALLLVVALVIGAFMIVRRRFSRPVRTLNGAIEHLSQRDYSVAVPQSKRRDEFGVMAETLESLRTNAATAERLAAEQIAEERAKAERAAAVAALITRFEGEVTDIMRTVASAATELDATAKGMASIADQTSREAAASASAADATSSNVQTVAAAAEEMASSLQEISRQVSKSNTVAQQATEEARATDATVMGLAEAASRIGEVVKLISDIASQTNLLALNATIEAARAGEAGKGFAVVASEVKTLASQTAKATDDISAQIDAIQAATDKAVDAIQRISATIETIGEITAAIAAAVEEQTAATGEISRNASDAAGGTQQVSATVARVTEAAGETGSAATQVLAASGELSTQSENLKREVESFLAGIRAA